MQARIRTAGIEDAAVICRVICRSITICCEADHQGNPAIVSRWLANKTVENVEKWISAPRAAALVAEQADQVLGVVLISGDELALCYVVPEALHKGIGKALLRAAEAEALATGIKVLRLDSTRTALPFYRRNGFSELGSARSWEGLEAQPMTKRLG